MNQRETRRGGLRLIRDGLVSHRWSSPRNRVSCSQPGSEHLLWAAGTMRAMFGPQHVWDPSEWNKNRGRLKITMHIEGAQDEGW